MDKKVLISLPVEELQSIIVDCVNSCLERNQPKEVEPINPHERLTRKSIKEQYCVSYGTIHNAMKRGNLQYEKVGRKTLFKRTDVEEWIKKKGGTNE